MTSTVILRRSWRTGDWAIEAAATIGLVRQRMEDAYVVGLDWKLAARNADVFAVFDGLGGMPNGDKASRAAADGLQAAMRATPGADSLLRTLNPDVIESRGMTTAVVALFVHGGSKFLAHAGDSSAYKLEHGKAMLQTPHDSDLGSITDQLGATFQSGYLTSMDLAPGESVLVCTDGVDGVLNSADLKRLLTAPSTEIASVVDQAMAAVMAAGAPDNATLILARRLPKT